jgi:hypothetical protein
MPAVRRVAILVLGMHRSGTSALAGLLVKLGASAPRTLMEPKPDNPLGFWESDAVCEFHDRLLSSASSHWQDWRAIPDEWFESLLAGAVEADLKSLLAQEYGDAQLFVAKDPRACRLVPLWLRTLESANVRPTAVLCFRHPAEVVRSLQLRNGLSPEHGLLLWLRHTLSAEFHTRLVSRCFVGYEDVLVDWHAVAARMARALHITWPERSLSDEREIGEFVQPALRHHRLGNDALPKDSVLLDWSERTWSALQSLRGSAANNNEAVAAMDSVRREFDARASTPSSVDEPGRGL